MKIRHLNHMLMAEYLRSFVLILTGFALIDMVYCYIFNFNADVLYLHWMCGSYDEPLSFSMIILKLLNISLVFWYIGNVCERFLGIYMMQLFCRIDRWRPFLLKFTILLICHAEVLLLCSHCSFYFVSGDIPEMDIAIKYFLMDGISLCGLVLVFILLNNAFAIDHGLLYIMGVLVVNTFTPIPIPLATSTIRYAECIEQFGYAVLFSSSALSMVIVSCVYVCLVSKRRMCIC